MTKHEHDKLTQYLELCRRIYERMRRENTWPWKTDSQDSEDMLESSDNQHDL